MFWVTLYRIDISFLENEMSNLDEVFIFYEMETCFVQMIYAIERFHCGDFDLKERLNFLIDTINSNKLQPMIDATSMEESVQAIKIPSGRQNFWKFKCLTLRRRMT